MEKSKIAALQEKVAFLGHKFSELEKDYAELTQESTAQADLPRLPGSVLKKAPPTPRGKKILHFWKQEVKTSFIRCP
jgi:hypothetical protein